MAKKIARKKKYLKPQPVAAAPNAGTFEIDKNPPPLIGRWNPNRAALLAKVDETLKKVGIGEAFIISVKEQHSVNKHLKDSYPADKFSFQRIHDNVEKLRVYRLAYNKKK